jgi:hypothetical protein
LFLWLSSSLFYSHTGVSVDFFGPASASQPKRETEGTRRFRERREREWRRRTICCGSRSENGRGLPSKLRDVGIVPYGPGGNNVWTLFDF